MTRKNILTRSWRKRADELLAENRLTEAAELYGKICHTDKMDTDAWVMRAVVQLRQGDLKTARDRLQAVDHRLDFMQSRDAMFKLYSSIILAEMMLAAGDDAEAHLLLSKIRSVNPPMVAEFELSGFRILGLGRS